MSIDSSLGDQKGTKNDESLKRLELTWPVIEMTLLHLESESKDRRWSEVSVPTEAKQSSYYVKNERTTLGWLK